MSFKIFSLQLLGKIKPVENVEIQRKNLRDDFEEFKKVEVSDELKEFLDLQKTVQSREFLNRKKEIQHLGFKGSHEESLLNEFKRLKNTARIKNYFKLKDTPELRRYENLKDSEKLKEYRELKDFVENGSFGKEKGVAQSLVYNGSEEQKKESEFVKLQKSPGIKAYFGLFQSEALKRHDQIAHSEKLKKFRELKNLPVVNKEKRLELKRLQNDPEIRNYLKFEHSKKLKLYRETAESYNLKRFGELKTEVENAGFKKRVEFLKDKKKFEKTNAFAKWKRFKELASDGDIKFFLKFDKSSLLENYRNVAESADLKRYAELNELVNSEPFLKQKAYLEDVKKWEKSEDYALEQKYSVMQKRPHLVKYFKYLGTDAFDFFTKWEVSFEEDFQPGSISKSKWITVSPWAEKTLGRNYALPGDLHIFSDGKNIRTGGKLDIETRKEKAEGMVWNKESGFVPSTFDFTSGLLSSAKSFSQTDGIFEAKIKFDPVKETVSSMVLQGDNAFPGVWLLEMGAKNRMGVASLNEKGKLTMNGLDISNLKTGKWYIFTLEKSDATITWRINDTEVLKLENQPVDFPLHINLLTMVIAPIPGNKLPVRFQTGWIKCYHKK